MRGLAAIGAVLGAAASLNVQKTAQLDSVRIEMAAVNSLGLEEKLVERLVIKFFCLCTRPVVPFVIVFGHGKPNLPL
jgi:hypothetical protein